MTSVITQNETGLNKSQPAFVLCDLDHNPTC